MTHEPCTKSIPLPFDESAAEAVFEFVQGVVSERLRREQVIPRDFQDILRKLDSIYETQKDELTHRNALIAHNRSCVDAYLEREILPQRDFKRESLASARLMTYPEMGRENNRFPSILKELYYLKAKMHLVQAIRSPSNNEPLKKQSRISTFEAAIDAFVLDLSVNPLRLDSWYGLALASLGICEEMMTWSAHYITENIDAIGMHQREAFWSLKRCIYLASKEIDDLSNRRALRPSESLRLFQSQVHLVTYYSELGHLLYSAVGSPSCGAFIAEDLGTSYRFKKLFSVSELTHSEVSRCIPSYVPPKTAIQELYQSMRKSGSDCSAKSPTLKRKRALSDSDGDMGDDERDDSSEVKSGFVDLFHFELAYPESKSASKQIIDAQSKRMAYKLAACCFLRCKNLTESLNFTWMQLKTLKDEKLVFSGSDEGITLPDNISVSWEWDWMLGKISAKLKKSTDVILGYYQQAILLARPAIVRGNQSSSDSATLEFGELNNLSATLGMDKSCEFIPPTFLSFFGSSRVSAVGLKHQNRNTDTVYKWLSFLTKQYLHGQLSEEMMQDKLCFVDISEDEEVIIPKDAPALDWLQKYFQRFLSDDPWYHRLVYRYCWLLMSSSKNISDDEQKIEFSKTAFRSLSGLFQLKSKFLAYWITMNEAPGKFYAYGHDYCNLFLDAIIAVKDLDTLGLLLKKLRKNTVCYDFLWTQEIRIKAETALMRFVLDEGHQLLRPHGQWFTIADRMPRNLLKDVLEVVIVCMSNSKEPEDDFGSEVIFTLMKRLYDQVRTLEQFTEESRRELEVLVEIANEQLLLLFSLFIARGVIYCWIPAIVENSDRWNELEADIKPYLVRCCQWMLGQMSVNERKRYQVESAELDRLIASACTALPLPEIETSVVRPVSKKMLSTQLVLLMRKGYLKSLAQVQAKEEMPLATGDVPTVAVISIDE